MIKKILDIKDVVLDKYAELIPEKLIPMGRPVFYGPVSLKEFCSVMSLHYQVRYHEVKSGLKYYMQYWKNKVLDYWSSEGDRPDSIESAHQSTLETLTEDNKSSKDVTDEMKTLYD